MVTQRSNSKTIIRVGIIGCGKIASQWDESAPAADPSLSRTHAKAFFQNPQSKIVSMLDLSPTRAKAAAEHWKVKHATSSMAEFLNQSPDVISICTPAEQRIKILEQLTGSSANTIICEKPLSLSSKEADKIIKLVTKNNWNFLVNYIRRFGTGYQELQTIINSKMLGQPTKIIGNYGKGLINNGSHMIDTLSYLIGPIAPVRRLRKVKDDRPKTDFTYDVQLKLKNQKVEIPIYLTANDHRDFGVFEIDIFFDKGRVKISNPEERIEIWKAKPDPVYPGYKSLYFSHQIPSGLNAHFENLSKMACDLSMGISKKHSSDLRSISDNIKLLEKLR